MESKPVMCGNNELTTPDLTCCEELRCEVDNLRDDMEECCAEVKRRLDGHDGDITNINNDIDNLEASKVDKVPGKGLSSNDFTDGDKNKLDGIEAGAQRNVQSDWNQTDPTKDDYIKNKPDFIPVGTIWMYGGAGNASGSYTEPLDGWAICNGAAVSRTTYASLFAVIGTTYGAGNGSTTFNLPDLRGRVPMGSGTGSGLTARTMGTKVGVESVTLTAAQSGMPAHTHAYTAPTVSGGAVTNGITGGAVANGITGGGGTTGGSGQLTTSQDGNHRHYTRYKAYWTQAEPEKTPPLVNHERFGTYSYAAATSDPESDSSYAGNHTHTVASHTHSIPSHTHNLPNHTHSLPNHTHTVSGGSIGQASAQNAGSSHTNVQPSLGINFIIRVK